MYELHIYGGRNIEETKNMFATQKLAMKEAERRASNDTRSWEEKDDGSMVMIDYNNSEEMEDLVINKVSPISDDTNMVGVAGKAIVFDDGRASVESNGRTYWLSPDAVRAVYRAAQIADDRGLL